VTNSPASPHTSLASPYHAASTVSSAPSPAAAVAGGHSSDEEPPPARLAPLALLAPLVPPPARGRFGLLAVVTSGWGLPRAARLRGFFSSSSSSDVPSSSAESSSSSLASADGTNSLSLPEPLSLTGFLRFLGFGAGFGAAFAAGFAGCLALEPLLGTGCCVVGGTAPS